VVKNASVPCRLGTYLVAEGKPLGFLLLLIFVLVSSLARLTLARADITVASPVPGGIHF
jgi:hypothetical protein